MALACCVLCALDPPLPRQTSPYLCHHVRVELLVPGAEQGVGDVQPLAIKTKGGGGREEQDEDKAAAGQQEEGGAGDLIAAAWVA